MSEFRVVITGQHSESNPGPLSALLKKTVRRMRGLGFSAVETQLVLNHELPPAPAPKKPVAAAAPKAAPAPKKAAAKPKKKAAPKKTAKK